MNKRIGKWMVFCVAFMAAMLEFRGAAFAVSPAEREALIAIYEATGGDNWEDNNGWLGAEGTECEWYGVTCVGDKVTGINLEANNLVGPLPVEIGNFVNLTNLFINDNQVTSLPAEIENLLNLTNLYASYNQLTGLPTEIGNLTKLTNFYMSYNQLTSLPTEIGNLINLTDLHAGGNQLTTLPPEFINLTNLSTLDICYNNIGITDDALTNFLDEKAPGWQECQISEPVDDDDGPNSSPSTPSLIGPSNESIDADGHITLQITNYADPENDAHLATQWMVRRADMPYNRDGYEPSFTFKMEDEHLTEHPLENLISGMKYFWKAAFVDEPGDTSPESQEIAFKVGTSTTQYVLTPPGEVAADFEMISFVQWPDNPTESAVIGDDMGGTYDTTLYRIGTYDPMINGYVEYGKGMKMEPGRAYWVFARHGLDISVNGVPVTLDHAVEIPLAYNPATPDGWNMIAPPNDRTYTWDQVEIVVYDETGGIVYGPVAVAELNDSNPYIDKRLWSWENGVYNPDAQDLFSRHGYWVRAFRENVSLRFPAKAAGPAPRITRTLRKAAQWISAQVPGPRAANADTAGDSPPAPIGGFTGETADSGSSDGDGGCFILTSGR